MYPGITLGLAVHLLVVSDFMINSPLKNSYRYICGMHGNVLTGMHRRKRTLSVYQSRDDQIAIGAKLLDNRYKFYGFNDDKPNREH